MRTLGELHNAVKQLRQEELAKSNQLRLGELIALLEDVKDKSQEVYYDFAYLRPTNLDSYRGYYDELALGYSVDGKSQTVTDLLEELRSAIGKTYEGYKGGDFVMDETTPVWVSNYSETGSTAIVGIKKTWAVLLLTQNMDDTYEN